MTDKLALNCGLPDGRHISVIGRPAEALRSLVEAGPRGITSLEAFQAGWAVRLAAYIHRLRSECGLVIETKREPHQGGSHARYVLHTPVELTERSDVGEWRAA